MIILLGGAEIAIVLVIFIAILAGSAEAIINMTNFFIILFVVKNVIQTIIFGHFKNKNPLSYTLGFAITDTVRIFIFFSNLRSIGMTFVSATGLRYFSSLFGFILYSIFCGSIFLLGEFLSLVQARNTHSERKHVLFGEIFIIILLAVVTWVGYL